MWETEEAPAAVEEREGAGWDPDAVDEEAPETRLACWDEVGADEVEADLR